MTTGRSFGLNGIITQTAHSINCRTSNIIKNLSTENNEAAIEHLMNKWAPHGDHMNQLSGLVVNYYYYYYLMIFPIEFAAIETCLS